MTTLRRVQALEKRRSVQRCIGGWVDPMPSLDEWEAIATRQQDALRRSDEPECAPPVVLMALSVDEDTRDEVRRQVRHRLKEH